MLLAQHKVTQEFVAIKAMRKAVVIQDDEVECTLIERRVLAVVSEAPFCVKLHSTFQVLASGATVDPWGSPAVAALHPPMAPPSCCGLQTKDRLFFIMEFVSGGDMMFHIQVSGAAPFVLSAASSPREADVVLCADQGQIQRCPRRVLHRRDSPGPLVHA